MAHQVQGPSLDELRRSISPFHVGESPWVRFIPLLSISLDRDILDGHPMLLPSLCLPVIALTQWVSRDATVHDLPVILVIDRKKK